MQLTKRVFEQGAGWHYAILQDDVEIIVQDCLPGADGFVPMTQAQANDLADGILTRLETAHADNQ